MRVKIINLILLIASWLPVFSLTEDEKYGELKIDNSIAVRSQLRTWRLSLFQIMLGAYKFYIPVILIGNRISQKFYTKKQPQTD